MINVNDNGNVNDKEKKKVDKKKSAAYAATTEHGTVNEEKRHTIPLLFAHCLLCLQAEILLVCKQKCNSAHFL